MGDQGGVIVYIVATHFGTHYCGITNNLIRRWKEHVNGKSSYLRRVKPREVVYVEMFENRRMAARKERKIKSFGVSKFIQSQRFLY